MLPEDDVVKVDAYLYTAYDDFLPRFVCLRRLFFCFLKTGEDSLVAVWKVDIIKK